MSYKLLVFDWDGTLADSLQQIISAMEQAIDALGLEQRDHGSIRNIIGLGLSEAIHLLYPDLPVGRRMKLRDLYRDYYLRPSNSGTRLFPGAEDMLMHLRERGYLLGVATGKSRRGLDRAMEESGLTSFFHATRCADETFSKPHPQMLQEIMSLFDIPAEHTLMIGDSEHDLQMAKNAGVESIAVKYGAQGAERLLEFDPILCIDELGELSHWLSSRSGLKIPELS